MGVLVLITFIGANLQAVFWQSSNWLVSTVLPAVVVDLTNQERADVSAQPLQRSSVLDAAAKMKAEDMAKNEYFAHFSPTGVSPWYWFDKSGYVYAHAGENLAIHFTDSSEVVEAWMNSPAHRENIVNGKFTEIGVGTAKGKFEGYDTVYVVQLFGTPAVAPVAKATKPPVETTKVSPVVESPTLAVAETPVESEIIVFDTPAVQVSSNEVPVPATKSELAVEQVEVNNEVAVVESVSLPEVVVEEVAVPVTETASEPVFVESNQEQPISDPSDEVMVIESLAITTSSGLAVANTVTPNNDSGKAGFASVATQPNQLLQSIYMILGFLVLIMLTISIVVEARRLHYTQVAYGLVLIFGMGGLWFVNSLLTSGAVIL